MSKTERSGCAIILEGADCAGKSTLALAIAALVIEEGDDLVYLHGSPWPGVVHAEHKRMLRHAEEALRSEAVVVIDHFWVAESMYGAEYRGAPAYDPAEIDSAVQDIGGVIALCVPHDRERQVKMHAERHAKGLEHFAKARGVIDRYYDLSVGNPDRLGHDYLSDSMRTGSFVGRSDVVLYDMWSHQPAAFAQRLLDKGRKFRAIAKGETK